MRLNHDAVREVLLFIEENVNYDGEDAYITNGDIISKISPNEHYTKKDIRYALEVLLTTDFLNIVDHSLVVNNGELIYVKIKGLTFAGCNFLDTIRKPEIWEIVKKKALQTGNASISVLSMTGAWLAEKMMMDPDAISNFLQGIENLKNMFH